MPNNINSVAKVFTEFRGIIFTGLIIILILVAIYWYGKKSGEQKSPDTVKLPNDVNPSPTWNPGPYTDAIWRDVNSFGWREIKPYKDLNTLSDSQLVAVYNDWNKRYYAQETITLVQAIENEYLAFGSYEFRPIRDALLLRFKKLLSNR